MVGPQVQLVVVGARTTSGGLVGRVQRGRVDVLPPPRDQWYAMRVVLCAAASSMDACHGPKERREHLVDESRGSIQSHRRSMLPAPPIGAQPEPVGDENH